VEHQASADRLHDTPASSVAWQADSTFGLATAADLRRRRAARAARSRRRVEATMSKRHQAQLAGKPRLSHGK
jgi:hypothetical protein